MCAIVDANVTPEVFGGSHPTNEAGRRFLSWLNTGRGKLVLGGKLRNELGAIRNFRKWAAQAVQAGIVQSVDDAAVNKETRELESGNALHSDDAHIIALARVSGGPPALLERPAPARGLHRSPTGQQSSRQSLLDAPNLRFHGRSTEPIGEQESVPNADIGAISTTHRPPTTPHSSPRLVLTPSESGDRQTLPGTPTQAYRGGGSIGEGTAGPPLRQRRLLLGTGGPAPRQASQEPGSVVSRRAVHAQPRTCSLMGGSCYCLTSFLHAGWAIATKRCGIRGRWALDNAGDGDAQDAKTTT